MKYFQKVKGARIYLSPICRQDAETYTKWMNDNRVTDNLGRTADIYTLETEAEILDRFAKEDAHFSIVSNDNDELLGNISLFNISYIHQTAEIAIFIGEEEHRHKGYGTEAMRLMIEFGFNSLNLYNIVLRVFAYNELAITCYEKICFKKMGIRRQATYSNGERHDIMYMDLLKGDYSPSNL